VSCSPTASHTSGCSSRTAVSKYTHCQGRETQHQQQQPSH
jgi:hypothetical protein